MGRPCTVLGAGSWGTALALQLARNRIPVRLWGRDPQTMQTVARRRENARYLPGVILPRDVEPLADLAAALDDTQLCVIAVPSGGFRDLLRALRDVRPDPPPLVWATKGLEMASAKWLHEVVADEVGAGDERAVLSGPSFAREVARGLPTAVTVASPRLDFATRVAELFHGEALRVYISQDIIGVELGGAVKNVLAIAAGISDGLGYGANARAALITRGLHEIMYLGERVGASRETLMGLSGLGDLVLTCTDDQSRNRRFGLALGRGTPQAQAREEIAQAIEGIDTAKVLARLAREAGLELPICQQVQRVLFEGLEPRAAVSQLLARRLKQENE